MLLYGNACMCIDATLREEHFEKSEQLLAFHCFAALNVQSIFKKKIIVQYRRTHHYFKAAFTFQGTGALLN